MISRTPRHVVVLDVDDTLYLESSYVLSGFRAVGAHARTHLAIDNFAEAAERLFAGGQRGNIFDLVLAEHGGTQPTPGTIDALVAIYRAHRPAIALEPDARRFIARSVEGRALAVLSDGYLLAQQAKVRALGLEGLCFPIVLTDGFGRQWWKPSELGFRHIQQHHGLAADRFLYVADNPAKDFVAPMRLGWHTVRLRRPGGLHHDRPCEEPPTAEIASFDELTEDRLADMFARRAGPAP